MQMGLSLHLEAKKFETHRAPVSQIQIVQGIDHYLTLMRSNYEPVALSFDFLFQLQHRFKVRLSQLLKDRSRSMVIGAGKRQANCNPLKCKITAWPHLLSTSSHP